MIGLQERDFFAAYKQAVEKCIKSSDQDDKLMPHINVMRASGRSGFWVYMAIGDHNFKLSSFREDARRFGKLETVAELLKKYFIGSFRVCDLAFSNNASGEI